MDNLNFGTKELYEVCIKATYPIEINGKKYEKGETIFTFEDISMAALNENKSYSIASGGHGNREKVLWEEIKSAQFSLDQGKFSMLSWALLSNSELVKNKKESISLDFEEKKLLVNKEVNLKYKPIDKNTTFIYKLDGKKITSFIIEDRKIIFDEIDENEEIDVVIKYSFLYEHESTTMEVGHNLLKGYLELVGKMRIKDDKEGLYRTGILKMPKIRIMSDLSIRLGQYASPTVNKFFIVGHPVGERGKESVYKIIYLDDEIDNVL